MSEATVFAVPGPHGGDEPVALVVDDEVLPEELESAAVDEPHAAIATTNASSPQRTRTRSRVRAGPNLSK